MIILLYKIIISTSCTKKQHWLFTMSRVFLDRITVVFDKSLVLNFFSRFSNYMILYIFSAAVQAYMCKVNVAHKLYRIIGTIYPFHRWLNMYGHTLMESLTFASVGAFCIVFTSALCGFVLWPLCVVSYLSVFAPPTEFFVLVYS